MGYTGNPHFMSYEVVELKFASPVQTIFTSESYEEAFSVWEKSFNDNGQARLDIIVREKKTGRPLFRSVVLECKKIDSDNHSNNSSYQIEDYGRFGPSVYNHDYKDAPWGGYEAYSKPVTSFLFNIEEQGE